MWRIRSAKKCVSACVIETTVSCCCGWSIEWSPLPILVHLRPLVFYWMQGLINSLAFCSDICSIDRLSSILQVQNMLVEPQRCLLLLPTFQLLPSPPHTCPPLGSEQASIGNSISVDWFLILSSWLLYCYRR